MDVSGCQWMLYEAELQNHSTMRVRQVGMNTEVPVCDWESYRCRNRCQILDTGSVTLCAILRENWKTHWHSENCIADNGGKAGYLVEREQQHFPQYIWREFTAHYMHEAISYSARWQYIAVTVTSQ